MTAVFAALATFCILVWLALHVVAEFKEPRDQKRGRVVVLVVAFGYLLAWFVGLHVPFPPRPW